MNNTPLFNYDSYEISPEAKNIYMNAVDSNGNSIFIKTLQEFLDILKVNNFRLTEEVDKYRKGVVENILSEYSLNESTEKDIIAAMQSDIDILKVESNVQQIEESNYGDSTQITRVLMITDNELQFDAVIEVFSGNFKDHYKAGKNYPYYTDAAMGGQRGITVKDNFGVWHSFGYRVNLHQ